VIREVAREGRMEEEREKKNIKFVEKPLKESAKFAIDRECI